MQKTPPNYIEVYVDIYPNRFSKTDNPYQYSNIQAVHSDKQERLEACLSEMRKNDSSLLLESDLILPINKMKAIEEKRKCYLNLDTQQFEFR